MSRSGGVLGVRDAGALESSVAQPFQTHGGEDLYPDFVTKTAAQAYFLIRNHPFIDGNKRVGHATLEVTLALNQLELFAGVDDQEAMILSVADGSSSRHDFTTWVNRHIDRLSDKETLAALETIKDFPHIRARMTRARAESIRRLRVDESYSWRAVAAECHEQWVDDASWEPPSNQLAGMELCEAAAEYFDEHFLTAPWN
jgi:death-on-curing protein